MKNSERTYWLISMALNREPGTVSRSWKDEALEKQWICGKCGRVVVNKPVPVEMELNTVPGQGLNFVFWHAIGLVELALIKVIGANLFESNFHIGPVQGANGKPLEKWRSFHAKFPQIYVRGYPPISEAVCPQCHHRSYVGDKQQYLCPDPLISEDIASAGEPNLIVNETLALAIQGSGLKGLRVERLPVYDEPKDELPKEYFEKIPYDVT